MTNFAARSCSACANREVRRRREERATGFSTVHSRPICASDQLISVSTKTRSSAKHQTQSHGNNPAVNPPFPRWRRRHAGGRHHTREIAVVQSPAGDGRDCCRTLTAPAARRQRCFTNGKGKASCEAPGYGPLLRFPPPDGRSAAPGVLSAISALERWRREAALGFAATWNRDRRLRPGRLGVPGRDAVLEGVLLQRPACGDALPAACSRRAMALRGLSLEPRRALGRACLGSRPA